MDTFTLSLGQPWFVRALGRNPLVRWSDRLESVLLILVFATALIVMPVAGAIGTAVYESRAHLYAEQAQTRHTIAATVVEPSTPIVGQNEEAFRADARWQANGVEHFGSVELTRSTKVGDRVDVWVDADGSQVAAPMSTSRAAIEASFAGVGVWLSALAGVTTLSMLARWWLSRRHCSGWDREWRELVNEGGGRTSSQP